MHHGQTHGCHYEPSPMSPGIALTEHHCGSAESPIAVPGERLTELFTATATGSKGKSSSTARST